VLGQNIKMLQPGRLLQCWWNWMYIECEFMDGAWFSL